MVRGMRGATTVLINDEDTILCATEELIHKMIEANGIEADDVSHIIITVTEDLNATFPAKVIRKFEGWMFVPIMCAQEIPVPTGLPMCIRVLMTVNTSISQEAISHIYLKEASKLRPDLQLTKQQD
jgi:chorismate mutase